MKKWQRKGLVLFGGGTAGTVLGMIDIHPGQGAYISSETNFFIIPLLWSLFLNGNQTEDIITVRNILEVKEAELAAGCNRDNRLGRLNDSSHKIHKAYMDWN